MATDVERPAVVPFRALPPGERMARGEPRVVYQVACAMLGAHEVAQPVRDLLRSTANADFVQATVTGLDPDRRAVATDRGELAYDFLVLAAGSVDNDFGNESVPLHGRSLAGLPEALELRNAVNEAFERWRRETDPARRRALLTFAVVGGGPAGVEFAGAMAELLRAVLRRDFHEARPDARVVVLEAGERILPTFEPDLAEAARRSLERRAVTVRTRARVRALHHEAVELEDGAVVEAATVVWAAGVRASGLGALLGVELDRQGRVPVTPTLQVLGRPEVFVIGDLARRADVPMLARTAIEEGRHAARVIRALMTGRPAPPFRHRDPGIMAIVGRGFAIAQIGPFRFRGLPGWWLWLSVHIVLITTFRSRVGTLIDWAWAYLFRRPPMPIEVRAADPPPGERSMGDAS